jgi:CRP/FNR family transcriptional regulator, anaerobic regulatory protein
VAEFCIRKDIKNNCASSVTYEEASQRPSPFGVGKSTGNLQIMEKLISFLNSLHPVSGTLESALRDRLRFIRKKKNEFLLFEGEICHYAWYLQKGLVRCYYDRDEHEVTTWFMEEDHVIVLFESLFRQKKSIFNIQALEDCELYGIRYEDILHVLETYPEARYIHTIISDRYSKLKDIRIRATSMLGPKERYRYFEKHFPQLLSRVKLEYIASYLDMDIRTLTRARKPE